MGTDEETSGSSPESADEYVKRSDLEDLVRSILHSEPEPSEDEEDEDEPAPSEAPLTLSDIERVMEEKVTKAIRDLTAKKASRPKPAPKPPASAAKIPEDAPVSPSRVNIRERIWGKP